MVVTRREVSDRIKNHVKQLEIYRSRVSFIQQEQLVLK